MDGKEKSSLNFVGRHSELCVACLRDVGSDSGDKKETSFVVSTERADCVNEFLVDFVRDLIALLVGESS